MKKSMVTRRVDSLVVLIETSDNPTDEEWDEFLNILAGNQGNFSKIQVLVMTDGGGPDREQRKRLAKVLADEPIRVAVVSDSAKVRFIASSIFLLNRDHGCFANKEIDKAFDHLRLSPSLRRLALTTIAEMKPLVG
jgi:hypothetical protein